MTDKEIERARKAAQVAVPVTLEYSLTGLTPAKARKTGLPVTFYVDTLRNAMRTIGEAGNGIMYEASLLTFNVLEVENQIGKGRLYPTQGDYITGHVDSHGRRVSGLGYAKSYGALLKRLGRAAALYGVRNGSADWAYLTQSLDKSEVAKPGIGAVKAVLDADEPNVEAFKEAMTKAKAGVKSIPAPAAGEETPEQREARIKSEHDGGGGDITPPSVTAKEITKAIDMIHALQTWEQIIWSLPEREQVRVENEMIRVAAATKAHREGLANVVKGEAEEVSATG